MDDGISGTTFERDGFRQMLDDVQKGLVGAVIVKDLSRFGRDYVMSGYYTEIVFLQYDVQFIAITDRVDSVSGAGMDFLPFHNLMNDWYARDISKKEKAVILHKGNSGGRLNPNPIYGYKKDEDKQWIIDEEVSDNVREIFRLFVDKRKGVQYIANYLYAKKILSPRAYRGDIRKGSYAEKMPCLWSTATIGEILDHQEYCGDTVNFRTEKNRIRAKKYLAEARRTTRFFMTRIQRLLSVKCLNKHRKFGERSKDTQDLKNLHCLNTLRSVKTVDESCTSDVNI